MKATKLIGWFTGLLFALSLFVFRTESPPEFGKLPSIKPENPAVAVPFSGAPQTLAVLNPQSENHVFRICCEGYLAPVQLKVDRITPGPVARAPKPKKTAPAAYKGEHVFSYC